MPDFATLEEAQAEIIRLNEECTRLTNERDTFSHDNETLKQEAERLRTLNQNYFNKLSQQYVNPQPDPEPQAMSCEEFARNLKI